MDKFYNTTTYNVEDKRNILIDAKELSNEWWVDVLETSSYVRKKINMPFVEILNKLNDKSHFVVICRDSNVSNFKHGEIGFSTITETPEYFLFINLEFRNLIKILNKYNLNKLLL